MRHYDRGGFMVAAAIMIMILGLVIAPRSALAQGPTIDAPAGLAPGSGESLLGRSPGAGGSSLHIPGTDQPFIGGATGTLTPRVPPSITTPGGRTSFAPEVGMSRTPTLPEAELPIYGTLSLPTGAEAAGPPNGMTLDQAIDRVIAVNLDLRAKSFELPIAEADILTASLRANPIFYADAQLVPYGRYTRERPGGQTQYDVNLSIPLDLNQKRRARMDVASQAHRVLQEQYKDAVRLTIDNLYTMFVDLLAARETARFAKASVEGYDQTLEPLKSRLDKELIPLADYNRVLIQRDFALIGLNGAEETLRKTKHTFAVLLNVPTSQADQLEIRGLLQDQFATPPAEDALIQIALRDRPDLAAFRMGVQRATADVRLAVKNRFTDVYWLVQPYTLQDNTAQGLKSPTSWATGITVPLPLFNQNQGNIRRAQLNVEQTQVELAALERQVVTEVHNAERDYAVTRTAVKRVETDLLPAARQVLQTTKLRYDKGEVDVIALLAAQREFNDVVRQYRDLLVQHRRSMLRVNTVVGRRLLP